MTHPTSENPPRQRGIDIQSNVDRAFQSKLWAYVAVVGKDTCHLGMAVANENGYSPIPPYHYSHDNFDIVQAEADRLNTSRGMAHDAVLAIVASSMFRVQA